MNGLYLFCLLVGGPLLVWFAAFGGDSDGFDADGAGDGVLSFVSLATVSFFLAFFGAGGLVANLSGVGTIGAAVVAVMSGLVAGGSSAWIFDLMRRTEASSEVSDSDLEGTIGRVSLAVGENTRGRIVLDVAGARTQMTASSVDHGEIEAGARVIVVGIEAGVAMVTRLDAELES